MTKVQETLKKISHGVQMAPSVAVLELVAKVATSFIPEDDQDVVCVYDMHTAENLITLS